MDHNLDPQIVIEIFSLQYCFINNHLPQNHDCDDKMQSQLQIRIMNYCYSKINFKADCFALFDQNTDSIKYKSDSIEYKYDSIDYFTDLVNHVNDQMKFVCDLFVHFQIGRAHV